MEWNGTERNGKLMNGWNRQMKDEAGARQGKARNRHGLRSRRVKIIFSRIEKDHKSGWGTKKNEEEIETRPFGWWGRFGFA
jgi:hypothetical protein